MRRFTLNLPSLKKLNLEKEENTTECQKDDCATDHGNMYDIHSLVKLNDDSAEKENKNMEVDDIDRTTAQEEQKVQIPKGLGYTKTIEILAEIFGFVPTQILDAIINGMNALIYEAITEVEKYVEEQLGTGPNSEKVIDELTTLFENALDKNFDKFELFTLKNVFNIPSSIQKQLSTYPKINAKVTSQELDDLDKEIEFLKRKIIAKKYYQASLKQNLQTVESKTELLLTVKPFLDQIVSNPTSNLSTDDVTSLEQIFENLKHLNDLQLLTETRIQQMAFQNMMTKADARSKYIANKITGFIQKKRALEVSTNTSDNVAVPSMKILEWSNQHTKAMQIGSVHDLQKLNTILSTQ